MRHTTNNGPRRDPVPRAREASSWLGGILLLGTLGAGVVAAATLLWENLDLRRVVPELVSAPASPPLPILAPEPEAAGGRFDALLFRSPRAAAYFPDVDHHPGVVAAWRDLLEGAGGRVWEVSTARELSAAAPDQVLVLPETACLTGEEREALVAHLDAGGSVVADWALGARDGDCEWRGWQVVAGITGSPVVREIPSRDALFYTVPTGLPLTPGLDPGTRVELRPDPSLAVRSSGARVYWSDWALNPAPDETDGIADAAAVVRRTEAGGRIAWFGFRIGQGATPRDSVLLSRTLSNGVLWAAGRPTAEVAPWPDGHRSALMMTVDVEAQPEHAAPTADLLRDQEVPVTWFAVSRRVRDSGSLGRLLSEVGEIGAQTPDQAPVAGLAPGDQRVRLRRASSELTTWAGQRPVGFRPTEEAFDAATVDAWHREGGRYLLGLNHARSASPEIHPVAGEAGGMILLPRLVKDDYNVFIQDGALRSERLVEAYARGMGKLHALGGLAVVSAHTQILDSEKRRRALLSAAELARAEEGWWLAQGYEIASWWRARGRVRVKPAPGFDSGGSETIASWDASMSERAGEGAGSREAGGIPMPPPQEIVFVVDASDEGLQGGWLELILPGYEDRIPLLDGAPVAYEETPWGVRLPLGTIEAGSSRKVRLVPAPPIPEPQTVSSAPSTARDPSSEPRPGS